MKKLYPSGQAMPTRTGPSEPKQSSHDTSHERMTTSLRFLLRAKSISPFYSYRRRAMVSSMSATSNLYDVLKRVDWLAIFSPWAIINRSKMYAMTTKQNTCATRTPATNVALKDFLRRAPLRSGLAIVRGSTTVLPNIFMVRRAHHDIKPNTYATRTPANNAALKGLAIAKGGTTVVPNRACELSEGNILSSRSQRDTDTSATRTPANKAALKALAIAKGGITVVPKIFSGEFFGSFFGVKKERPVAASDGKVAGRVNKTLSTSMDHTSSSSHILLLSTIFVLLNFCFISATHAQSQTHHSGGGAAPVVVDSTHLRKGIDVQEVEPLLVGQQMPDHFWERDYLVYSDGDTTRQKLDAHRKKLIVLDFWATWCAICLGRMKRTDSLFAKFPENVKLIYVNPVQTKDTYETIVNIQEKLSQMSLSGSFTSIIEDDYLDKLFPNRIYPRYAWIGPYGNLIALTTSLSVTEEHISQILKLLKMNQNEK